MNKKTGLLVAVAFVVIVTALFAFRPGTSSFVAWIAEARDGDSEWGWDMLSPEAHGAYDGDADAYFAEMAAVDWTALDLGAPMEIWTDDGFASVRAELRSDPSTVPTFLLDRRIVHGICDGAGPSAIGVFEDRRPFHGHVFDGGGVTGSQARCNVAFGEAGN